MGITAADYHRAKPRKQSQEELEQRSGQQPQMNLSQSGSAQSNLSQDSSQTIANGDRINQTEEGNPANRPSNAVAVIWSNPIFRSWEIRDLRANPDEIELEAIVVLPMVIETTRWARKAGEPDPGQAPAPAGQGGGAQPPASNNELQTDNPSRPPSSDRNKEAKKPLCARNAITTPDCTPRN
jgi:hypothetical protein